MLVLEAADAPGGAVRTEELTLPGFRHDTFSSVYPAAAASPVFARMPLARHGLEWVHPAAAYAHPLPDGGAARALPRPGRDRATASTPAAGRRRRWGRSSAPLLDTFDAVRARCSSGFPPLAGAAEAAPRAPARSAARFAALLPRLGASGSAERLFDEPGRARVALRRGDARRHAADRARLGDRRAYLNLLGHAVGWPSPRGGAQRLTDALVGYLPSLGGELAHRRAGRPASTPRAAGSPACACAGGERVAADTVIADVMPHALLRDAPAALRRWYRRLLRRYTYGPATVKVDWALDGPIPWENEDVRGAGTVHVGGGEDEFLRASQRRATACPSGRSCCSASSRVADPTRAPEGKHTAWAYTHGPRGRRLGGRARSPRRAHGGAGRALRARASATASSPATCSARPTCRRATRTCRR